MAYQDALIAKAKFLCGKVVGGEMTPYEASKIIWVECYDENIPGDHTFDPFVYWADEYEDASDEERRLYCEEALRQTARDFLSGA